MPCRMAGVDENETDALKSQIVVSGNGVNAVDHSSERALDHRSAFNSIAFLLSTDQTSTV